jgi:hypothetical protein
VFPAIMHESNEDNPEILLIFGMKNGENKKVISRAYETPLDASGKMSQYIGNPGQLVTGDDDVIVINLEQVAYLVIKRVSSKDSAE